MTLHRVEMTARGDRRRGIVEGMRARWLSMCGAAEAVPQSRFPRPSCAAWTKRPIRDEGLCISRHRPFPVEDWLRPLGRKLVIESDRRRGRPMISLPTSRHFRTGREPLGSGVIDQSQMMTVAARAMAEKKAVGHRSSRVATPRQSFRQRNMISMRLWRLGQFVRQGRRTDVITDLASGHEDAQGEGRSRR